MRIPKALVALALLLAPATATGAELRFLRDGEEVSRLDLEALKRAGRVETVSVEDPYYEAKKSYRAVALKDVLRAGFGVAVSKLEGEEILFQALDGYLKPASPARLSEDGGYVAFADAEHARGTDPGWKPIDRRQVDPGPFYVVWAGKGQNDTHRYPWPYQLAAIEAVSFETKYPRTLPRTAGKGSAAWRGFAIFRDECFSCHSINGQGGKVGPELNVPRSIVEYRPVEQLKEYIRDPGSFRHTTMPSHRHLSGRQLDELVAYFDTMKTLKQDEP
ncbi:MAG: c-type cytochrome [Candidatus Binatia bacterium]